MSDNLKNLKYKIWWYTAKKSIKSSLSGWLMLFIFLPLFGFLAGILTKLVVTLFNLGYFLF